MESLENTNFKIHFSELMPEFESRGMNRSDNKYEIVSKVAYLIGVPKRIFDNENEAPKIEIYNNLELQKKARIIRNLCILRTQLERNFLKICHGIQRENRTMIGMPEFLPTECFAALSDDGVNIYQHMNEPTPFLIHLNTNIKERINNCKDIFPHWLNWDYLSSIFIMPNGTTDKGTKSAAEFYYKNITYYPYQQYMNWPAQDEGNILFNDKKFVNLLYKWNGSSFNDNGRVSDASDETKSSIYTYIEESNKIVFIVDCENSDPYDLCAAIKNLDADKLAKIDKIILFDDIHAASAWEMLSSYIDIPVEYIMIERLKDNKSLADVKVSARTCKEFYANNVDSFVIVSSDSDYWGLIEELPDARFMVMVEHKKCSFALKNKLVSNGIFYCYIDNFYAGGGEDIRQAAFMKSLTNALNEKLELNLNSMLEDILIQTRIKMNTEEKRDFIENKLKKKIYLDFNKAGDVTLKYKK